MPQGPYLVLPLRGPTAVRDFGGNYIDGFFSPLYYCHVQYTGKQYVGLVKSTIGSVDNRANNIVTYRDIERASVDYLRHHAGYYRQRRQRQIEDRRPPPPNCRISELSVRLLSTRPKHALSPAMMPLIERIVSFCCRHAALTVLAACCC